MFFPTTRVTLLVEGIRLSQRPISELHSVDRSYSNHLLHSSMHPEVQKESREILEAD